MKIFFNIQANNIQLKKESQGKTLRGKLFYILKITTGFVISDPDKIHVIIFIKNAEQCNLKIKFHFKYEIFKNPLDILNFF